MEIDEEQECPYADVSGQTNKVISKTVVPQTW